MNALLAILTPIALISSASMLPSNITGIVASLGTRTPYLTASAFMVGAFLPQFAFGLLLVVGLDVAFDRVNVWMQDRWRDPDTLVVMLQLVIGIAMAVFGYRLANTRPPRREQASSASMSPAGAFSVAAGLTIVGLPFGLLYFAAIDQILRADLTVAGMAQALLYYNLIYLLPLMLIVLMRRLFGRRTDPIFMAVSRFLTHWGKQLLFFGLLGLGIVLVVDAIGWLLGFPLLPTYRLGPVTQ